MGTNELRRLRQLEDENRHLKQLVADLSLDKQMLQDVLKKSIEASGSQTNGQRLDGRLLLFAAQSMSCCYAVNLPVLLQIRP
jgi:putative transposase